MRILELCTSPDKGGLELYVARAAAALARIGEDVLAVLGPQSCIADALRAGAVETDVITVRFPPWPRAAAGRLARLIDSRGVDVIHTHWGPDLPLAALAKRLSTRQPRLVYTRHMQITRSKRDPYHRWIYRHVDVLLAITEAMAARIRERLPTELGGRVRTLYHGAPGIAAPLAPDRRVRLRAEWGVPEGAVLVGLFSRIEEPKGQHLLVEAVRRARDEGLALYALIVGRSMDTAYIEGLKHTTVRSRLDDRIRFEGFTDHPQEWMQACDIVALTTREETFGLVLIEAMQAGVAVIGSDRGGVTEIIQHQTNGLLFRSFDADDFYRQLRRLVVDPALRRELATRGSETASRTFNEYRHFGTLRDYLAGAAR